MMPPQRGLLSPSCENGDWERRDPTTVNDMTIPMDFDCNQLWSLWAQQNDFSFAAEELTASIA